MRTLEAIQEKHEKALREFQHEQAIRAELPERFREQEKGLLMSFHKDFATVMFHPFSYEKEQHKLRDALTIVGEFKDRIVESEHWTDGCTAIRPAKINDYAGKERAKHDGTTAIEIAVSGGKGYGPDVKVQFWAQLQWGLVEISILVPELRRLVPSIQNEYASGEIVRSTVTWPDDARQVFKFRKFWSSPGSYNGSYYFAGVTDFETWAKLLP